MRHSWVGEFERRSVRKSPCCRVWVIWAGFERQNVWVTNPLQPLLKALFYTAQSGFFRDHPASSGYCNIKCLLTLRSTTSFDVLGQSASPLGHFHDGSSLIASMGGFALCYLLSEEAMTYPSGHNGEEPSASLVVREIAISLHNLNTVWPG